MKITVIRPFLVRGVRQEIGATIDVADAIGRELVSLNKAVPAGAVKPAGTMTTDTAAAVVSGAKPGAAKPAPTKE